MKAIAGALSALKSGEGLKGQLMRGGVGSIAVKIVSTGLNLVLAIVLARTLGAEGFGVYSFVFALVTILAIPAQMGLPNLVVRETAKAQANGDWALMKGLWRWSSLMALAMSAALIALGALAAWIFADRLPEGGLAVFYWGLVLVPLVALGNIRGAALRGLRHVVQGQLPEFILRPAFLIVLVLAMHLAFSARALTASDAMMLHAIASLVAFGIGVWLLLSARPTELVSSAVGSGELSGWFRAALPLGMIEASHLLNGNLGLVFLGLLQSPEIVADYRIATQLALFVTFVMLAVEVAIAPHIARLHTSRKFGELQKITTRAAHVSVVSALVIAVTIIFFGRQFIGLAFGPEFIGAYFPAVLLSISYFLNSLTGPSGIVLQMMGDEKYILKVMTFVTILNAVMLPLFVLSMGGEGVALLSGITMISWKTLLYRRARSKFGINCIAIKL